MNDSEMTVAYHPTPWNKGKLIGQKPPAQAQRDLGLARRVGDGRENLGTRPVQPRDRQHYPGT